MPSPEPGGQPSGRSDTRIRVGLADKNPLIHAALTHLLDRDGRFELAGIWSDGDAFVNALDSTVLDVVVSGWIIEPGDARFILDHLRGRERAPRAVIYTGAVGESVPVHVMAHGGAAFVPKSEQPGRLLDVVAEVAEGRMIFPYLDVRNIDRSPLTKRELDVLAELAAGRTNKQIAQAHRVSLNTVKFHTRNLFGKLGVRNRSQAVALYLKS